MILRPFVRLSSPPSSDIRFYMSGEVGTICENREAAIPHTSTGEGAGRCVECFFFPSSWSLEPHAWPFHVGSCTPFDNKISKTDRECTSVKRVLPTALKADHGDNYRSLTIHICSETFVSVSSSSLCVRLPFVYASLSLSLSDDLRLSVFHAFCKRQYKNEIRSGSRATPPPERLRTADSRNGDSQRDQVARLREFAWTFPQDSASRRLRHGDPRRPCQMTAISGELAGK